MRPGTILGVPVTWREDGERAAGERDGVHITAQRHAPLMPSGLPWWQVTVYGRSGRCLVIGAGPTIERAEESARADLEAAHEAHATVCCLRGEP